MVQNTYVGVPSSRHVNLIASRAKKMGFPRDKIDDLQQTIVPKLEKFEFDPAKANGASEMTAIIAVIDSELRAARRTQRRYEEHLAEHRFARGSLTAPQEPVDLQIDVCEALVELSDDEQRVAELLASGASVQQIADELGCHWLTIDRIVRHIRERFEDLNLDDWVKPR